MFVSPPPVPGPNQVNVSYANSYLVYLNYDTVAGQTDVTLKKIPTLKKASSGQVNFWAGVWTHTTMTPIVGYMREGITAIDNKGKAIYKPWWEYQYPMNTPSPPLNEVFSNYYPTTHTMKAGDAVEFITQQKQTGNLAFTFTVKDNTQHWQVSVTEPDYSGYLNASNAIVTEGVAGTIKTPGTINLISTAIFPPTKPANIADFCSPLSIPQDPETIQAELGQSYNFPNFSLQQYAPPQYNCAHVKYTP